MSFSYDLDPENDYDYGAEVVNAVDEFNPDEVEEVEFEEGDEEAMAEFEEAEDSYIDTGAEWRDPTKSRVGAAHHAGQELENTLIEGKFDRNKMKNLSPEEIYQMMVKQVMNKYGDQFSRGAQIDVFGAAINLTRRIPNLRYRNPKAILLGLAMLNREYRIDNSILSISGVKIKKLDYLYQEIGENHSDIYNYDVKVPEFDIIKYAFFMSNVLGVKYK